MRTVKNEQYWDEIEREEREDTEEAIALMLAILDDLQEDIAHELHLFYRKYGTDGIVTYKQARRYVSDKDHHRRINLLGEAIEAVLADGCSRLEARLWGIIETILVKEHNIWGEDYDSAPYYGLGWQDGRTWRERLWDDEAVWLTKLLSDIKLAMVRGQPLETVLNQLGKRIKQMSNVVSRLVQSETVFYRTEARINLFKGAGVKHYRYYTQEDERVCETCGPMNDRVFALTEYEPGVTAPLLHVGCRCFILPEP